ncbi:MAG: aminotransferase class I/II-fold pyridoxal phosphate-dependent enzyme [bacterium]
MKRIPLATPHMSGNEQKYVKEAFDTNWIAPLGPQVDAFEESIKSYVTVDNAVALNSGTSAIHMALRHAKVQKDDIVFCSTLTFAASCNPIIYENATPVFIDSELDTWNMCPKSLEKAFKKYPDAKACVLVHLYGQSSKMDEIVKLCKKYNCILIEDAAESLGSTYKNKQTGTFGDYGIFSFNGNKIITTSGGGMLVSNINLDSVRKWSTQSRDNAPWYQHTELGFNYRLSSICAAVGRGQMEVLNERIKQKQNIFNTYKKELEGVIEMQNMISDGVSNCWLSAATLKTKTPTELINFLNDNNIEARHVWKPMHLQPIFEKYDYIYDNTSVSEELFNTGVCLPSDTKMTKEEQMYVISKIKECFNV